MNNEFVLKPQHVHLWQVSVPEMRAHLGDFSSLLNEQEVQRAKRFVFAEHRERFTIARGMLRKILSLYLKVPADSITFYLGERGKPYLQNHESRLQFNVSHSHDWVVYALAHDVEIGIDIEKITERHNLAIAERFFSPVEYAHLSKLPIIEQTHAFYRLWAAKEAVIKALGAGLYAPLTDFSIDFAKDNQIIELSYQHQHYHYYLTYFTPHPDYQAAFATTQSMLKMDHWCWTSHGPDQIS